MNDAAEEFGQIWNQKEWVNGQLHALNYSGLAAGSHLAVLFKPLSGLLNQNKMLPVLSDYDRT